MLILCYFTFYVFCIIWLPISQQICWEGEGWTNKREHTCSLSLLEIETTKSTQLWVSKVRSYFKWNCNLPCKEKILFIFHSHFYTILWKVLLVVVINIARRVKSEICTAENFYEKIWSLVVFLQKLWHSNCIKCDEDDEKANRKACVDFTRMQKAWGFSHPQVFTWTPSIVSLNSTVLSTDFGICSTIISATTFFNFCQTLSNQAIKKKILAP